MKRNVRKKILLLTVCTMIVGALLLTGCRPKNEIDDPWLKLWQEVVIDRDVKVTSVAFDYYTSQPKSSHERVISNDKKQISQLLDKLSAVGSDFTEDPYGDGTVEICAAIGEYFIIVELCTENQNSLTLWIATSFFQETHYTVYINQSEEPSFDFQHWDPETYNVFSLSDKQIRQTDVIDMISIFCNDQ